jgi:hypothetical protein
MLAALTDRDQQEMLVEFARVWSADLQVLPVWLNMEVVTVSSRVSGAQPRPISSPAHVTIWNLHEWDILP